MTTNSTRDKTLIVGGRHLPGCATSRVCRRFSVTDMPLGAKKCPLPERAHSLIATIGWRYQIYKSLEPRMRLMGSTTELDALVSVRLNSPLVCLNPFLSSLNSHPSCA
eukprot:1182333-Prorocentrum_minimum.AAC.2